MSGSMRRIWKCMKYADSLNVVCGNIRRIPGLIGFHRSPGLQILHQDSRFHLGFQVICVGFQLVSGPSRMDK